MASSHRVRTMVLAAALPSFVAGTAQASCDSRPGTPVSLVARNPEPGDIALSWQSVGNVHCFDIEVSKGGNVIGRSITGGNCGRTDILFKDLGYDQTYCFRVRARTEGGTEGCVSAQASNTVCSGTSNPPLATGPQAPPAESTFMVNTFFDNPSYSHQVLQRSDAAACQASCQKDTKCKAWTWVWLISPGEQSSSCDLKSAVGPTKPIGLAISGVRDDLVVK